MDIVLKDVSITVLESEGVDNIYINVKNITNGLYPFTGNGDIRIQVAHGTAIQWLSLNFGEAIINYINMKRV